MFRLAIIFVSVLAIISCQAQAVTVYTTSQLNTAIATSEPEILLDAANFDLTATLTVDHDCTIKPHPNRSGAGGVTLDGRNLYRVIFKAADIIVGANDPDNILTFTRGNTETVEVYSTGKKTNLTFNYCKFMYAYNGDGLALLSGAYELTVTCNNCEASYNKYDGFNFHNVTPSPPAQIIILNNCEATGNDTSSIGGAAGDAITGHDQNQTVYVYGGKYYNNGKGGVCMVGGSKAYVYGGTYYGNGAVANVGDMHSEGVGAYMEIRDVDFTGMLRSTTPNVRSTKDAKVVVYDCTFKDPISTSGPYVICYRNADLEIYNCTFEKATGGSQYAIQLGNTKGTEPKSAIIKNCSFYNNARHIEMYYVLDYTKILVSNNIFEKATSSAIRCQNNGYNNNPASGYNCFYNNLVNISTGFFLATDITVDPQFANKTGGDLHIKSQYGRWNPATSTWVTDATTSPCVDAGNPADDFTKELWQHGELVNIGAYGNTNEASMSPSAVGIIADFDSDGDVDSDDFIELIDHWLEDNAANEGDLNRDGLVNFIDYAIFNDYIGSGWVW